MYRMGVIPQWLIAVHQRGAASDVQTVQINKQLIENGVKFLSLPSLCCYLRGTKLPIRAVRGSRRRNV
jgi:hypothetical protein